MSPERINSDYIRVRIIGKNESSCGHMHMTFGIDNKDIHEIRVKRLKGSKITDSNVLLRLDDSYLTYTTKKNHNLFKCFANRVKRSKFFNLKIFYLKN